MAVTVQCPDCSTRLNLGGDRAESSLPCTKCEASVTAPTPLEVPHRRSAPRWVWVTATVLGVVILGFVGVVAVSLIRGQNARVNADREPTTVTRPTGFDPNDINRTGRWLVKMYETSRFTPLGNDQLRDTNYEYFRTAAEATAGEKVNWIVTVGEVTGTGTVETKGMELSATGCNRTEGYTLRTKKRYLSRPDFDSGFRTTDPGWATTLKRGDKVRLTGTIFQFQSNKPVAPPYNFTFFLGDDADVGPAN